ncbi:MAG: helix-turn-helix domain-containing protein [Rhodospirillales bacterium]
MTIASGADDQADVAVDLETDDPAGDRLLDAALDVIAERGWQRATMGEIALRGGVSLADVYRLFPTRTHLLAALLARTDRRMLAAPAGSPANISPGTESPRDRLFDVVMRRFDMLQQHRAAYLRLMRELPFDPPAMALLLRRLRRAMRWMVEAAGLPASGAAGFVRRRGLALIYLDCLRVWATDDSPDMARTMATLDRALRRADALVHRLPGFAVDVPPAPRWPSADLDDGEPTSLEGIPD